MARLVTLGRWKRANRPPARRRRRKKSAAARGRAPAAPGQDQPPPGLQVGAMAVAVATDTACGGDRSAGLQPYVGPRCSERGRAAHQGDGEGAEGAPRRHALRLSLPQLLASTAAYSPPPPVSYRSAHSPPNNIIIYSHQQYLCSGSRQLWRVKGSARPFESLHQVQIILRGSCFYFLHCGVFACIFPLDFSKYLRPKSTSTSARRGG